MDTLRSGLDVGVTIIGNMSNLALIPAVIGLTAVIFIALHGQRQHPVLAQLSILTGFIPVLVHELGHAITATLTRGQVVDIRMVITHKKQLKTGAQGQAIYAQPSRIKRIPIVFMGYAAPPLVLLLGVYLAQQGLALIFIALLALGLLYYITHTQQKLIPLILIGFIIYTGVDMSLTQLTLPVINLIYSIILGLLLGEVIQSIIITAKINFSAQKANWDGLQLRRLTFMPATLWWLLWTLISVYSIITITRLLLSL